MARQLSAFVTLKRLGHMAAHFQAAISFLYPPKDNRPEGFEAEPPQASDFGRARKAALGFLEEFFTLAAANVVDLRTSAATDAFEYETAREEQQRLAAAS